MHKQAPWNKELSSPNVNNAEIEEPYRRHMKRPNFLYKWKNNLLQYIRVTEFKMLKNLYWKEYSETISVLDNAN